MATTAAAISSPLLMAEADPSDIYSSPEEEEPEELTTPFTDTSSIAPPQPQNLETLPPAVPSPPFFINAAELKDLYAAIISFQQCYVDLHNRLDSIKAAILPKLPPGTTDITPLAPSTSSKPGVSEERVLQEQQQQQDDLLHNHLDSVKAAICSKLPPGSTDVTPLAPSSSLKPDVSEETVLQEQQQQQQQQEQNLPNSELEGLCKTMCSRDIRRYMAAHLSNIPKLREEVPKALKFAPNPPKLVLECLGKFFLQGSKAFTRNSPMIPAREASILILECFLLMMGMNTSNGKDNGEVDIEKEVREEAENAALAWRKRLVFEGGVAKANQIDARGLLLFVACFGIPGSFKKEDIRDLVIAANAKEIVGVLNKSHVLMNKIPEIVEGMMKNKMEVDAVDIVYTFGLEERFNPQTVLMQFLRESKESWKKPKKGQGSPATLNEVNKKQLAALKSIRKCLERHKLDPAKLLSGLQINEKIATLQKDIAEFDRKSGEKTVNKRKASETESSRRPKTQEAKRSRQHDRAPQQHKAAGHVYNRRNNMFDGGLPTHVNNYSTPGTVVYGGPGAGLLPESMVPSGVGPGMSASHGGILSTASYAGIHGGMLVDASGQVLNRGPYQYDYHGDSGLVEKYAGQPSSVGLTSLYRASASNEGFVGVANASSNGLGNQAVASDLYQFADSVAGSESYRSTVVPRNVAAAAPTAVPAHYGQYLYQA